MTVETIVSTDGVASECVGSAEFKWLLRNDVGSTLAQLKQILTDCTAVIPNTSKQYTIYSSSQNQQDVIKIQTTLEGYRITQADINIKLSSKHPMQTIKTCINEAPENPFCWRLNQIQDAANHLGNAIDLLVTTRIRPDSSSTDVNNRYDFRSADEVLGLIENVMNCLQKSRSSLLIPRKRTIEELQHSQNMQSIRPALPLDYSISFYIQAHNLICSVYQLTPGPQGSQIKAEYQAEVSLPFLSEILVYLSLSLQLCQQLKDKIQTLVAS